MRARDGAHRRLSMVRLNGSMMERYEIENHRPDRVKCVLLGADRLMLGCAAQFIDRMNESGENIGCLCVSRAADVLERQDGMFTLLVRGESIDGKRENEERVVQSIIGYLSPDRDYEKLREAAAKPETDVYICHQDASDEETALLALMLFERFQAALPAPRILMSADMPRPDCDARLREGVKLLASKWTQTSDFARYLDGACITRVLCEALSGPLSENERAAMQKKLNYQDDLMAWAEPQMRLSADENAPEKLRARLCGEKYEIACEKKQRVFDAAVFISACVGYISGMDSFAQVMKDEDMRALIAHAFFDEILPLLPWEKDEIAPYVISCFERLENPMNDVPLLDVARDMLKTFSQTILKTISAYADKTFEAPRCLSLALSAAIMLYAGARRNEKGLYCVQREKSEHAIADDEAILEAFSKFSHDMPAETLAYAALADRDCWGDDLREIDGLEMRVAYDLSAIQRIGMRETVRLTMLEYD